MTTDQKINGLRKGESLLLSESNGFQVHAERSCDGKWISIVRSSKDGFKVISRSRF